MKISKKNIQNKSSEKSGNYIINYINANKVWIIYRFRKILIGVKRSERLPGVQRAGSLAGVARGQSPLA